jgi:hypothetical protein
VYAFEIFSILPFYAEYAFLCAHRESNYTGYFWIKNLLDKKPEKVQFYGLAGFHDPLALPESRLFFDANYATADGWFHEPSG